MWEYNYNPTKFIQDVLKVKQRFMDYHDLCNIYIILFPNYINN